MISSFSGVRSGLKLVSMGGKEPAINTSSRFDLASFARSIDFWISVVKSDSKFSLFRIFGVT